MTHADSLVFSSMIQISLVHNFSLCDPTLIKLNNQSCEFGSECVCVCAGAYAILPVCINT